MAKQKHDTGVKKRRARELDAKIKQILNRAAAHRAWGRRQRAQDAALDLDALRDRLERM
ncbi:hypothetical protein RBS60_10960 [Sinomonas sp. ASV486]|uniref:hypothetical protein n=1 Tax=Sinomonas sp. ASV486 TaxID=3051170 RepID=UPI0027DBD37F|nr:hypothetical protein [Sinomonas sp. ASV486]MDQ4490717.1 hypothetical protein [Sinomonas sp. ASV486]